MKTKNFQSVVLSLVIILLINTKIFSTTINIFVTNNGIFVPSNVGATLGDVIHWYQGGPKPIETTRCDGQFGTILPTGAIPWHHACPFDYQINAAGFYFYRSGWGNYAVLNVKATVSIKIRLQVCSPGNENISVHLRSSTTPYQEVDVASGVLDSAGNVNLNYTQPVSGVSYFIVVKHRNSIETWSATPQTFSAGNINYDFTTGLNKAYGNNMVLSIGKACLYTGDVNQDGIIDITDISLIDNDAFNFVTGNVVTDLNCDGIVDGNDIIYADNNALNFIGVMHP